MNGGLCRYASAPAIHGGEKYQMLARKVFESGMGRIEGLEALQRSYRQLMGSNSGEISGRMNDEAARLERVLDRMIALRAGKAGWESLSDTQRAILVGFESKNHERDELFQAADDKDVRFRLAMRDMDESEYSERRYGALFEQTQAPVLQEKEADGAPVANPASEQPRAETPDIRDVDGMEAEGRPLAASADSALKEPDSRERMIVAAREALMRNSSRIAPSTSLDSKGVRAELASYTDSELLTIHMLSEELGVDAHKIAAADIQMGLDGVPKSRQMRMGSKTDMRIQNAAGVCFCRKSILQSITSTFRQEYERAYAERIKHYNDSLIRLRTRIFNEAGPGAEEEAQKRYDEESRKIMYPERTEYNPEISLRRLIEISNLFSHNPVSLELFTEFFDSTFECAPKDEDRSSRPMRVKQIAEFHGISRENASALLRSKEKEKSLDGFNPTAERIHRIVMEVLRGFVKCSHQELELNRSSKLYHSIERSLETSIGTDLWEMAGADQNEDG